MQFQRHVRERGARTLRTISSDCRSLRKSPIALTAWIVHYAIQAGREIRIIVKPEVINDEGMVLVARDIVKKIEDELDYPGQIKVNIIRESRAVGYAK